MTTSGPFSQKPWQPVAQTSTLSRPWASTWARNSSTSALPPRTWQAVSAQMEMVIFLGSTPAARRSRSIARSSGVFSRVASAMPVCFS